MDSREAVSHHAEREGIDYQYSIGSLLCWITRPTTLIVIRSSNLPG